MRVALHASGPAPQGFVGLSCWASTNEWPPNVDHPVVELLLCHVLPGAITAHCISYRDRLALEPTEPRRARCLTMADEPAI